MRRGRRGRPQLLCPPCPPIGRCVGQGAGTKLEAKTSLRAERCDSLQEKAARAWRDRCAAPRSSSGCQTRSRRSHGRPAPALRASSGTAELGHRGTKGSRSQDRCRQAVLGSRSHHSAKPVSSVRLRGTSTMQPHRLCVPRICIDKSYRESKQGRRHCVAHLLGGVQPIRACRVLQRSTPVLVPFLLRGKVRLPVVLHDSRTVEWGSHAVSSSHTSAVSKASRGRGQHHERPQRASSGHSNRNNSGRPSDPGPKPGSRHPNSNGGGPPAATGANLSPSKHVSTPEGPVKSPSGPRADTLAGQQKDTRSSTDSTDSQQTSAVPLAQSKPASGSGSTALAPSHSHSWPVGSAKSQGQPSSKASRPRANSFTHTPGQQHPQPLTTSWGPSQPAQQSPGSGSGSAQHPSPSTVPSPGGTTTPGQPQGSPNRPGESATKASKSIKHQKKSLTQLNPSGTIISMQSHNGPNRSGESPPKASKSNKYQKKSPTQSSTNPSGKDQQPPTSTSRKDQQPPTSTSRKDQQPPTSTSGKEKQPTASTSGKEQQPPTSTSRKEKQPTASTSGKDQQPPTSTSGKEQQPTASASGKEQQPTASTSVPELTFSPLEYTTESTTEITCTWPHHYSWLRYLQHLWRLKHLSC